MFKLQAHDVVALSTDEPKGEQWGTARVCVGLLLMLLGLGCKASGQAVFRFPAETYQSAGANRQVLSSFSSAGVLAEIRVVSKGLRNSDYRLISAGDCAVGQSYSLGAACSPQVEFVPQAPGERNGAVLFLDSSNNVLGERPLYGIGTGPVAVFTTATINTIAGNGQWLYTGDGVLATNAPIFLPSGVAVDAAGDVYLADSGNNRIRLVNASTGIMSTVAGTGSPGSNGDGGPAINASISTPGALLLDGAGDLYIADSGNHAVRKLSLVTGKLTTVAGQLGQAGNMGDGGLATSAKLNTPEGLAMDSEGNLYIADTKNNAIREIDISTGFIQTIAGTGTAGFGGDGGVAVSALLNAPWGIANDSAGNLYIADLNNNRIRKVSGGNITTIVGDGTGALSPDGQSALSTSISNPAAITVDVAGNIYVADSGHNVVRKVNGLTGVTSIVAGNVSPSFTGDMGPATAAGIYGPYALTLDATGNLYIADIFHHRIRKISTSQSTLSYPAIRVGRTSAPQLETVENDGNAPLVWSGFYPDVNATISTATTTCMLGTSLPVDTTCSVGAEFFPQVTGSSVTARIQLLSDAVNSSDEITLSGEADELDPTSTAITIGNTNLVLGAPATFIATVAGSGSIQPVGNVRFFDGSTQLGTSSTSNVGIATFTTSVLALGTHNITANFTGDASDSPSTSTPALRVIVKQQPTVSLSSSLNPSKVGNGVIFNALVTASSVQPTGTLALMDGGTILSTMPLVNGAAAFTLSTLAAGSHSLTAAYSGDVNTGGLVSTGLIQIVHRWPSTASLASTSATTVVGSALTYTVTVTPSSTSNPSGRVTIEDNGAPLATLTLGPAGTAALTTSLLAVGTHAITALFPGDLVNDASSSAPLSTIVQPAPTITSLVPSANPAVGGASVQFTANVSSTSTDALPAVSGIVTFKDGVTILGSIPLSPNGTATLSISNLAVATHSITAVYAGDTDHATSTSAPLSEQILLATTSLQLVTSSNPLIFGHTLTLTAVVGGNGAIPSGAVTFLDGATPLGIGNINASGQATITISTLATGNHLLSASYPGDLKDSSSSSNALTETISQATTGLILASTSNPSIAGTAVTFVVTLNSNGSLPSGQIALSDGGVALGTAVLNAFGVAQITLPSLAAGSHNLVATFVGDANHTACASATLPQIVNLATSAVVLTSSANPTLINTPVMFTATVTGTGLRPSGSVTFTSDATVLATEPITASGTATLTTSALTLGAHAIGVFYTGDLTHVPSAVTVLSQRIQQASSTTLSSSADPALVGAPVVLTATVTGATAGRTGSVTFFDGTTVLGLVPFASTGVAILPTSFAESGTHRLIATFSGDAEDQASTSTVLAEVVNLAATSVNLISSSNPSVVGNTVLFTATVTSFGNPPSGTVNLRDGDIILATKVVSRGLANFPINSLVAGSHSLTASYAGDVGTGTSTSDVLLQVAQQTTATTLASSNTSILTDQVVTLTASVAGAIDSTGTVTFLDGSKILGTATVTRFGQATIAVPALSAGSHLLYARFGGDPYHLASNSSALTETVQLRPSTTSLTSSSNSYLVGQQLTLVAVIHTSGTMDPTGSVTFTSSGGVVLGTSTLSAAGAATIVFSPTATTYDVIASYSGDASYSGSSSTSYLLAAGSTNTFTITSTPVAITLASGAHTTLNLTLNSSSSFSDTLSFGCVDLPVDATCTFIKPEMVLAANSFATAQVVVDTGNPLGSGIATTARVRSGFNPSRSTVAASLFLPLSVLSGILLWRSRARHSLSNLVTLLLCTVAALCVSGCGTSFNSKKTPTGIYNIRVVAAGTQTGVSQFATITVTVR